MRKLLSTAALLLATTLCLAQTSSNSTMGGFGGTSGNGATFPNGTVLTDDASNYLAQRKGAAPQTLRVYNTFTDAADGEWGGVDWNGASNILQIGSFSNGTGSPRPLRLIVGASQVMYFNVSSSDRAVFNFGAFYPTSASALDLGATNKGWGHLYLDYVNTGTVGAVTISKPTGRANIAAAGSSVVVTNTVSTANAHCFANLQGAQDSTAKSAQCDTSTAGQITIRLNAAATAQVAVDFLIINAD